MGIDLSKIKPAHYGKAGLRRNEMSITKEVQSISQVLRLAFRPSQTYTTAIGAYTIFSIDGMVSLITLGARITAAADGAEQLTTLVNTIGADSGAVAVNGAVGTVVWVPLNVAGAPLNAAGVPKTIATGTLEMIAGCQTAAGALTPGVISATYSIGVSATMEWFCIWRKLSSNGRVY
jgi:hypothetical protein